MIDLGLIPIHGCSIVESKTIEFWEPNSSWAVNYHTHNQGWTAIKVTGIKPPFHTVLIGDKVAAKCVRDCKEAVEVVDRFNRYNKHKAKAIKLLQR
jgi:hypothetical protein